MPEALEYLREATSTMQRDGTSALHKVTMGYNMARLQEETGDTKAASQAYKVGSRRRVELSAADVQHSVPYVQRLGAF